MAAISNVESGGYGQVQVLCGNNQHGRYKYSTVESGGYGWVQVLGGNSQHGR